MTKLSDKEVGAIWAEHNQDGLFTVTDVRGEYIAGCWCHQCLLIRKLVDERAFQGDRELFTQCEQEIFLRDALRKYGIDPASFTEVAHAES